MSRFVSKMLCRPVGQIIVMNTASCGKFFAVKCAFSTVRPTVRIVQQCLSQYHQLQWALHCCEEVRQMWYEAVAGDFRNLRRILVGKPEGKRTLLRPRLREQDNIEVDPKEVGQEDSYWINLDRETDNQWDLVTRL